MNKKLGAVAAFLILPLGAAAAAFAVSNDPGEPDVAIERVSQDLPRYDAPADPHAASPSDDDDDRGDDDADDVPHDDDDVQRVQPQVPQAQFDDDWDDDDWDDDDDDWDDDDYDDDWDD